MPYSKSFSALLSKQFKSQDPLCHLQLKFFAVSRKLNPLIRLSTPPMLWAQLILPASSRSILSLLSAPTILNHRQLLKSNAISCMAFGHAVLSVKETAANPSSTGISSFSVRITDVTPVPGRVLNPQIQILYHCYTPIASCPFSITTLMVYFRAQLMGCSLTTF